MASFFWNLSSCLSSRASMSSWTSAAAVMKPTERPFWQAAKPRPRAMWVLPVPLLPSAMRFSRRLMYSQRASSRTNVLLSEGMTLKSKLSRALDHGEARRLDAPLDHAALAVDQLELGKTQKIANVVDASEAHCRAILSYSLRNVGSFSLLRWWTSSTCRVSVMRRAPTAGSCTTWQTSSRPGRAAGTDRRRG